MKIIKLEVENFRNIENEKIEFSPDTNLIYGNNAEGKTNVIEAIYYFANSKSFRTSTDRELILFGKEEAKLKAVFEDCGKVSEYEIRIQKNGKREFYYNSMKISKMSDFFGKFRAVLFVPEHLKIVKNGPSERRALMDSSICQLKKSYISDLYTFSKVLAEKNAVLKDYHGTLSENTLLDVYDENIIKIGSKITEARREWTRAVFEKASVFLKEMSGDSLTYQFKPSGFVSEDSALEFYKKIIPENRKRDINYRQATVGANRDDVEIFINSLPLRTYGSQGQQRSVVIALKLGEGEWARESTSSSPIYLFDDILSELDFKKEEYILSKLSSKQVIITTPSSDVSAFSGKKIYVEKGEMK